jgi:hypothetical protein
MVLVMFSVMFLCHGWSYGQTHQQDCSESDRKGLLHLSPFVVGVRERAYFSITRKSGNSPWLLSGNWYGLQTM